MSEFNPEIFSEQFRLWQLELAKMRNTEHYSIAGIEVDKADAQVRQAIALFNGLVNMHNHLVALGEINNRLPITVACCIGVLSDYSRALGVSLDEYLLQLVGQEVEKTETSRILLLD